MKPFFLLLLFSCLILLHFVDKVNSSLVLFIVDDDNDFGDPSHDQGKSALPPDRGLVYDIAGDDDDWSHSSPTPSDDEIVYGEEQKRESISKISLRFSESSEEEKEEKSSTITGPTDNSPKYLRGP
eukprot:scaffold2484_cov159-Ochromonas_danica.AAC.1